MDGNGNNAILTELATTVLLFGASSSPKKKGVEAPGEPAPAPEAALPADQVAPVTPAPVAGLTPTMKKVKNKYKKH